jgi:hypothetical protein
MRSFCAIALIVGLALPLHAQELQRWSFSGNFSGSSNSDGTVTKVDPALGYSFTNHFSMYTGVPFYMVKRSSSATTSTTTATTDSFMSGIGNAFLGFRLGVDNEALNYSSTLEMTAPTGDKTRGFSTGRVTADWTNRFSRKVSSVTPFGSIGIANTVSDTAFFVRPFTSLGKVAHFEGGATYDFARIARLGASAYAVRGTGQQTVISKVIKRQITTATSSTSSGRGNSDRVFETQSQTVSQADIVNDHGYSTWFGVSPKPEIDFHAGYSRSVNYDFNTFFFGVGFHVSK